MNPYQRYLALLERLGIQAADSLYVHTSYRRLATLGVTVTQVIDGLLAAVGGHGTVVMPSFAWNLDRSQRPWKGYRDYFDSRPVFDVARTPANIGAVPEQFRHHAAARRSMNYWWSVCAIGKHAIQLTTGQEAVEHPYGPGSSFDMLRQLETKIVGLGVSTNTNSLALTPDYALGSRHPHQVFTPQLMSGMVVDLNGTVLETRSIWLLPAVVRAIKPSAVIDASPALMTGITRADQGSDIYFSYTHELYHIEALRLARVAVDAGQRVPWLADYARRDELAAGSYDAAARSI